MIEVAKFVGVFLFYSDDAFSFYRFSPAADSRLLP